MLSERPELHLRPGIQELRDDPGATLARSEALGVAVETLELLVGRGIEDSEAQQVLLTPRLARLRPPQQMAGFEPALELLVAAVEKGWRVGIFGDYDVDGVTTTTILSTFLECLGVQVVCRVATREAGYGFVPRAAEALADAGCELVLTGDCGTSDHEAISLLRGRDIPVVIIDHHQVPEEMPPANALLNPHQEGCEFPFKGLCSAGVAFYVCAALRTRLAQRGRQNLPDPRAWLDLVALGTVCDMVPLVEENRVLTSHGLALLQERRRPGIRAVLERARVGPGVHLDESHLGFTIGPRLNAPGRLSSAEPSLSLLRARSDAEASAMAAEVEMFNTRRKEIQRRISTEALAMLDADPKTPQRAGLVVGNAGWAPGVVGIAANGLVERFNRPALILGVDPGTGEARGSARSCAGVDVRAALMACMPLLKRCGGHKAAAGVSLDAANIPELVEAFDAAVAEQVAASQASGEGEASGEVVELHDGERPFTGVDRDLLGAMDRARPFGQNFSQPRYLCSEARIVSRREVGQGHLKIGLAQDGRTLDGMIFNGADMALERGQDIGALFMPQLNSFRGRTSVELRFDRIWKI